MDIMSLIGLLGAMGLVLYGVLDGGPVSNFINSGAVAITVGGTFAALMLTFPLKVFASMPKLLMKIFLPGWVNPRRYVNALVEAADDAKRNGMLYVDKKIPEYKPKDAFLRRGITLAIDAANPSEVRNTMQTELDCMIERHKAGVRFFEKAATLATGFGMLGTLTGLINLLAQANDPNGITQGMAAALVTTFYGLIMANVIFLPMGNKLRRRSDDEVLCRQIIIEGVVSIIKEESPKQIQEKLESYIPPSMRRLDKIDKKELKERKKLIEKTEKEETDKKEKISVIDKIKMKVKESKKNRENKEEIEEIKGKYEDEA